MVKAAKSDGSPFRDVYAIVAKIPRGRVMSYGQIAGLLERRLSARAVGWAMRTCPSGLPWHRVVNASGGCSSDELPDHPGLQRALLEAEGIAFDAAGRLSIDEHRWAPRPKSAAPRATGPLKGSRQAARTRR
jgi:methylated-DNA-protein-cysteine methyltransferase related protein